MGAIDTLRRKLLKWVGLAGVAGTAPPALAHQRAAATPKAPHVDFLYAIDRVSGEAGPRRLFDIRASGKATPVILGGLEQFKRVAETFEVSSESVDSLLAKALALDPLKWIEDRAQSDPDYYEIEASDWPENASPNDALSAHIDVLSRKPLDLVYIALLPTQSAWQSACYLKIGGWNEMPFAPEHSALWRYWEDRYGAKVACLADDVIEFTVDRPPQTREEALVLARQQFIYCADIVHQGVGSVEALAATILKAPVWYFWWD